MSENVRSKDELKSNSKVWTDSHSLQQGDSLLSLTLANTIFFHLYQLDKWGKKKKNLLLCFQIFFFSFKGALRMTLDPMIPHVLPFLSEGM